MAVKRWDALVKTVSRHLSNVIDLVAQEGRYHCRCHKSFFSPVNVTKVISCSSSEGVNLVMNQIFSKLENMDDMQISYTELVEDITGAAPHSKTIIEKLQGGDSIFISQCRGLKSIIRF